MRNIDEGMHKDSWYRSLTERQRLAWTNMITQLADDQGRFVVDTVEMRYTLFSGDHNVSDDDLQEIVEAFARDGKVVVYAQKNTRYCQLVNWWKYQNKASFMSASKYPAPDKWADCYRYNGKAHKIHDTPNWKERGTEGGFGTNTSVMDQTDWVNP
jgi:hypothetical protein